MARWVSYWMSRKSIASLPFHLTVLVNGKDCTPLLDSERIFARLRTRFKRVGGETGLLMTATSAAVIFEAMLRDQAILAHVPGPNGLPGGYPVRVHAEELEIALPAGLTLEQARQINEKGLRFDGIERIGSDGTIIFTNEAVSIYQGILGYTCHSLPLDELEALAKELQKRYELANNQI